VALSSFLCLCNQLVLLITAFDVFKECFTIRLDIICKSLFTFFFSPLYFLFAFELLYFMEFFCPHFRRLSVGLVFFLNADLLPLKVCFPIEPPMQRGFGLLCFLPGQCHTCHLSFWYSVFHGYQAFRRLLGF